MAPHDHCSFLGDVLLRIDGAAFFDEVGFFPFGTREGKRRMKKRTMKNENCMTPELSSSDDGGLVNCSCFFSSVQPSGASALGGAGLVNCCFVLSSQASEREESVAVHIFKLVFVSVSCLL